MRTSENRPVAAPAKRGWTAATTVGAVFICCCIFYVSSIPGSGLPSGLGWRTTAAHFVEYACLGVAVALSLRNGKRGFWTVVLVSMLLCSIYGASDEFHQWFVPGRNTDVLDWLTDTIGAFVGSLIATKVACRDGENRLWNA